MQARQRRWPARVGSVAGHAGRTALVVFALFPIVWFVYTSFRPEHDIITESTRIIPRHLTLHNYYATWKQTDFPRLLLNSVGISMITVLISLTLGTLAAYSLSRGRFHGQGAVLGSFLVIRIIPGVLLLIPIYVILLRLRLLDTWIGLAITYTTFTLPVAIWFMKGFFDALPLDLENAARVDGCTRIGALRRIAIPLVLPGLAATGTFVAISAWNDFLFALLLTSSLSSRTWPVGLKLLIGEFQLPWGQLAAATVISLVPVVVGFAFAGKAMVAGLTAGGIKD